MWHFEKKKESHNIILAMDIGTASVSVAIAVKDKGGKADVLNVFRYYYNALSSHRSRLLLGIISKAFNDVYKFEKNISVIRIALSSPFFWEQSVTGEIKRKNPQALVSTDEIDSLFLSTKTLLPKNIEMVYCDIISSKIDDYEVPELYGYRGEILKIEAKIFAINHFLKKRLKELKEEFFPKSVIFCVSDTDALKKLALMLFPKRSPAILDVGAEISVLNSEILPLGIRTLERRVASFFKIGLLDAENIMRKLTYGTLDFAHERAVNKVISKDSAFWGELVKEKLKIMRHRGVLFISGAGADFPILKTIVKENLKSSSTENMNIKILSPNIFKENFIHIGSLSGGKDAVLTALILAYD